MVLEKFHECWLCDYYIAKQTKGERVKPWCCWHDKEMLISKYIRDNYKDVIDRIR